MTPEEWMRKADWEGGIYEAITEYGLSVEHIDPDADPEFIATVQEIVDGLANIADAVDKLMSNWDTEAL